jgi:urease accessory protein
MRNVRTRISTMTPAPTSIRKLLGLLQLASPALPIGGFSYSQGLESAVEVGLIHDAQSAKAWIESGVETMLGPNELPMLAGIHRAWEDENYQEVKLKNAWFLSSRESLELRQETEQMGWSLAQLALSLSWHDKPHQVALRELKPICLPAAFAYAAGALAIDAESCVAAYSFIWVEKQVAAAVKAVPLGQIAGQKILYSMHPLAASVALHAIDINSEEISTFAPHLAIISARHANQYSRLFRS